MTKREKIQQTATSGAVLETNISGFGRNFNGSSSFRNSFNSLLLVTILSGTGPPSAAFVSF
jgi:hypothetical protein